MIKRLIKRKIIDPISINAVCKIANSNADIKKIWEDSIKLIPDFRQHYSFLVESNEIEKRIRLLVVFETFFVKKEIDRIIAENGKCSYADIGDSDGSVRLLLKHYLNSNQLDTVGINLQKSAVDKMKKKGLNAICADAQSLGDRGLNYDIVSLFETLEHLPDPIRFLAGMTTVVKNRLIVSVPFIRRSRVGLAYLSNNWAEDNKPTIENTHIFELSPKDWKKIFLHSGWKVEKELKLMMFPATGISRFILQPFWRFVSFEGFWFVSLIKNDRYSSKYGIE